MEPVGWEKDGVTLLEHYFQPALTCSSPVAAPLEKTREPSPGILHRSLPVTTASSRGHLYIDTSTAVEWVLWGIHVKVRQELCVPENHALAPAYLRVRVRVDLTRTQSQRVLCASDLQQASEKVKVEGSKEEKSTCAGYLCSVVTHTDTHRHMDRQTPKHLCEEGMRGIIMQRRYQTARADPEVGAPAHFNTELLPSRRHLTLGQHRSCGVRLQIQPLVLRRRI